MIPLSMLPLRHDTRQTQAKNEPQILDQAEQGHSFPLAIADTDGCLLEDRWRFLNISLSTKICRPRVRVRHDRMAATAGTRSLMGVCAASMPASATILAMEKPCAFCFSSWMTCPFSNKSQLAALLALHASRQQRK